MEPTTTPMLSPIPLSAAPAGSLASLQNPGISAENANGAASGLFAALLGQLTGQKPVAIPVTLQGSAVSPSAKPPIAATELPLAGNPLPLPITIRPAEAAAIQLASETISETIDPAEALPLSGLPQPATVTQLVEPATAAEPQPAPTAIAAPVLADSLTAGTLTPPRLQATDTPDMADTQDIADSPVADPDVFNDRPPAPVTAATRRISVEPNPQLINSQSTHSQPPQNNATDNAIAVTAAGQTAPQPAGPTTPSQPSLTLSHPITDPRWGDSLGQRVVWMTDNGIGRAEIRLNPPELGPLHVRVTVTNDEARVAFSVQHGATRELVESALPRLREMFAAQGLELTDASVSQHSPQDRHQAGDTGGSSGRWSHGNANVVSGFNDAGTMTGNIRIHDGLIDTYA